MGHWRGPPVTFSSGVHLMVIGINQPRYKFFSRWIGDQSVLKLITKIDS